MTDELAERLLKALENIDRRLTALEARPAPSIRIADMIMGPPPVPDRVYPLPTITYPLGTGGPLPDLPTAICELGFYSYPGDSGHTLTQ